MGDLFGGGGSSKQTVTQKTVLPPEVTNAMRFVTGFGEDLVNQGTPQSFQSFLQTGARPYPGQSWPAGSQQPNLAAYQAPVGSMEQFLTNLFMGGQSNFGAPGNPYVQSIASGQIPTNTLQDVQNQIARSNANITESFGTTGQRFGTGLADTLSRNANQAITALGADTEKQALAANAQDQQRLQQMIQQYLLTGGALMGSQADRINTGFANLFNDFIRQTGLPMGLDAIISGAGLGRGAGTTTSASKGSTGGNPLGEIGQLGQAGQSLFNSGLLSSLFGSGTAAGTGAIADAALASTAEAASAPFDASSVLWSLAA